MKIDNNFILAKLQRKSLIKKGFAITNELTIQYNSLCKEKQSMNLSDEDIVQIFTQAEHSNFSKIHLIQRVTGWLKILCSLFVLSVTCYLILNLANGYLLSCILLVLSLPSFINIILDGKSCKYNQLRFNNYVNKESITKIINIFSFLLILGWFLFLNHTTEHVVDVHSGSIVTGMIMLNIVLFVLFLLIKIIDLITVNHKNTHFTINYMFLNISILVLLLNLLHSLTDINHLSPRLFELLIIYSLGIFIHLVINKIMILIKNYKLKFELTNNNN